MSVKPKVLILSGYGFNCEEETAHGFTVAGASADIVHINDVIEEKRMLAQYQIMVFAGGFSYGDDTGSGNAMAQKIRNNFSDELFDFVAGDKLLLGICNGFQVLVALGMLPGNQGFGREKRVALTVNDSARYVDRWVDIAIEGSSPWVDGIGTVALPIAHAEGRFYAPKALLAELEQDGSIAARYTEGEMSAWQNASGNPNGSLNNVAGLVDESGRILGMMPHPERAMFFTQLPNWTYLKELYRREGKRQPHHGPGLAFFQNAVRYF